MIACLQDTHRPLDALEQTVTRAGAKDDPIIVRSLRLLRRHQSWARARQIHAWLDHHLKQKSVTYMRFDVEMEDSARAEQARLYLDIMYWLAVELDAAERPVSATSWKERRRREMVELFDRCKINVHQHGDPEERPQAMETWPMVPSSPPTIVSWKDMFDKARPNFGHALALTPGKTDVMPAEPTAAAKLLAFVQEKVRSMRRPASGTIDELDDDDDDDDADDEEEKKKKETMMGMITFAEWYMSTTDESARFPRTEDAWLKWYVPGASSNPEDSEDPSIWLKAYTAAQWKSWAVTTRVLRAWKIRDLDKEWRGSYWKDF